MKNCAGYVALGKVALGDPRMSDKRFGESIKRAQQTIADAKAGRMSDETALAVGELLVKHRLIEHAGEVMLIAHAERKSGRTRSMLMDYAKNVLASVPSKAVGALCALAVALGGMFLPARDAQAVGGDGEIRTHGRLAPSSVFKTDPLSHSGTPPVAQMISEVAETMPP